MKITHILLLVPTVLVAAGWFVHAGYLEDQTEKVWAESRASMMASEEERAKTLLQVAPVEAENERIKATHAKCEESLRELQIWKAKKELEIRVGRGDVVSGSSSSRRRPWDYRYKQWFKQLEYTISVEEDPADLRRLKSASRKSRKLYKEIWRLGETAAQQTSRIEERSEAKMEKLEEKLDDLIGNTGVRPIPEKDSDHDPMEGFDL